MQLHACKQILTHDYGRSSKVIRKPVINLCPLQPRVISDMCDKVSVRFVSNFSFDTLFPPSRAFAVFVFFLNLVSFRHRSSRIIFTAKERRYYITFSLSQFNQFSEKNIFKSDALRFSACVPPNTFQNRCSYHNHAISLIEL